MIQQHKQALVAGGGMNCGFFFADRVAKRMNCGHRRVVFAAAAVNGCSMGQPCMAPGTSIL